MNCGFSIFTRSLKMDDQEYTKRALPAKEREVYQDFEVTVKDSYYKMRCKGYNTDEISDIGDALDKLHSELMLIQEGRKSK